MTKTQMCDGCGRRMLDGLARSARSGSVNRRNLVENRVQA